MADAAAHGARILTDDDVPPGVPDLLGSIQVEAFFNDGKKLVTVHDAIRPGTGDQSEACHPPRRNPAG
ncbi:urease subunit gamma [Mycolicibacterium sarraceniae]|uniref:Uncharacterized protein n=1 Tax=Mycolicibacterium sarraceniae TaxID=1534348 RepID=A0A7I7SUK6_9MYCO|nr:urease subunit gamma [Mycolicibacterium sarraceniae]BBY59735.1 hypothetical protein MSAR_28710 [Mycolicibacterium sarraceniae]